MIRAELPNGAIVEFEDGTAPAVMKDTVRRLFGKKEEKKLEEVLEALAAKITPQSVEESQSAFLEALKSLKESKEGLVQTEDISEVVSVLGIKLDSLVSALENVAALVTYQHRETLENQKGQIEATKELTKAYLAPKKVIHNEYGRVKEVRV